MDARDINEYITVTLPKIVQRQLKQTSAYYFLLNKVKDEVSSDPVFDELLQFAIRQEIRKALDREKDIKNLLSLFKEREQALLTLAKDHVCKGGEVGVISEAISQVLSNHYPLEHHSQVLDILVKELKTEQ